MSYYIGVEDLVANALIEIVENTGKRSVSFADLQKYGDAIIARLKKDNTDAVLIFTRDRTAQFFHDCSDVFTITEKNENIIISLNEGISTTYLRNRFRVRLALAILTAFVSQEAIKTIIS